MSARNRVTTRNVSMELRFHGTGAVVRTRAGAYNGGVVDPVIDGELGYELWREVPDEDGIMNPVVGEDTVAGGFQLSLEGTSAGYRELARYLLAIAELDTSADPDFHEHHELQSADRRTRLHIIVRKRPPGGT